MTSRCEITALIDPHQFDLITRTDSGLVVIQGGAGSGKTTIGLHRLAFLAYRDQRRFRPDHMFVVVFNEALCRYISQVLPSLGIEGVAIRTYGEFTSKLRISHFDGFSTSYCPDTPSSVTKLKKHPVMLRLIDDYVSELAADFESKLQGVLERNGTAEGNALLRKAWEGNTQRPLRHRIHQVRSAASKNPESLGLDSRVALERLVADGLRKARDVTTAWADILSDFSDCAAYWTGSPPARLANPSCRERTNGAPLDAVAYSAKSKRSATRKRRDHNDCTESLQTPTTKVSMMMMIEASASTDDNLKRRQH